MRQGGGASSTLVVPVGGVGTFACKKCQQVLPREEESTLRKGICKRDISAYKSLSDRWSRNRQLKDWYDSQSHEQMVLWYLKQQKCPSGQKRKFDCEYSDASVKRGYALEQEEDHWITFDQFFARQPPGTTLQEALATFAAFVNANESECLWRRNQWLIPTFVGVRRLRGCGIEQHSTCARIARAPSADDLRQLQGGGDRLLQNFAQQVPTAIRPFSSGVVPDTITATPADMPTLAAATDVMANAVAREVTTFAASPLSLLS